MGAFRNLLLLVAMVAFAAGMAVFGRGTGTADADVEADITPVAGTILVHKHCIPGTSVGTFNVTLDFTFEGADLPLGPDGQDSSLSFDRTLTISCADGDSETLDGDTVLLSDDASLEVTDLGPLFEYLDANGAIIEEATASITEASAPGVSAAYESNLGPPEACDFTVTTDEGPDMRDTGIVCVITNTIRAPLGTSLQIEKIFTGEEGGPFSFNIDTSDGSGCTVEIDNAVAAVADGASFFMAAGDVAEIFCTAEATVAETPGEGFILADLMCSGGAMVEPDSSISYAFPADAVEQALCQVTNDPTESDDPGVSNLIVEKVCTDEVQGTFSVDIGGEAMPIACGGRVTFGDLEPGSYTLTETIEGGNEGLETTITCDDTYETTDGTAREVTVGEEDVTCTIANGVGIQDVICPCLGLEIDLEIDNHNTNVIGVDNDNTNTNANNSENENDNENTNANENNNTNTNTQGQTNNQDQDNTNKQTNNIDASPEINIR